MTTTLPLFWHLSSASKKERLDASTKLIGALEQFQTQFAPTSTSDGTSRSDEEGDDDEDTDEENNLGSGGLDALNAPDVSYSIRRLVRGLASPRESSRLGFAVALTEVSLVEYQRFTSPLLNKSPRLAVVSDKYSDLLPDNYSDYGWN